MDACSDDAAKITAEALNDDNMKGALENIHACLGFNGPVNQKFLEKVSTDVSRAAPLQIDLEYYPSGTMTHFRIRHQK